jgi:Domain of unknown function (DUF4383)
MEAAAVSVDRWTFAQKALVVLATLELVWATAGLVAEPSFDFGANAATERVLWVDFNGVHALSGFLLFLPAFYFALRPRWAVLYCLYAAAALIVTGIWAFLSTAPAGVFTFPNNDADGVFHVATGFVLLGIAAVQARIDRRAAR